MSGVSQTREQLITKLKTAASELLSRAEEIVGDHIINLSDLTIHIYLDPNDVVTYDVDKSFVVLPPKAYEP